MNVGCATPFIRKSMTLIVCPCGGATARWICRPLNNPQKLQFNAYTDNNPKGFGLLQLDRDFSHYQDIMGWYNKRPSLWVEPRNKVG